ncbi:Molybdenum-binding ModE protein [Azotobacter vinelandii CA]|uniref:Molybdenum-binding ModE protein n=2 Tax=Azotobacter vinelandii TaxID=354 RepID=C1DPS5_AZOVD|nr:TOBE domain-containing protein [Azotobacter vinelandii]ACO79496.1 Molybdenum-binding ModE protein [Azotobacter vinelandii DJ]AGK14662.1 Molybdenum-binding ModE protein [Azotobacter vinelandii CA]AGK21269.1 Molybdenum-binding ModE protein [Azotobacter vinelandii CA6]WKN20390.1 TOBE domain-containing protein [Azotobacter vinelandii]SFY23735.1 molybdate transport system regulatory protein [Azotobacter vinelandii]
MTFSRFLARLSLDTEVGTAFSDTRIRLLEAIEREGSINRAAKTVPLSYKSAWDAIDTMNNLAAEPLVVRVANGRQGGGTRLTDYGRRIVAIYRLLEIECQSALDRLSERLDEITGSDIQSFQHLMHSMSLKSSACNQFAGIVTDLRADGVDYEVHIRLDAKNKIAAIITKASVENLELAIGKEIFAWIKSSSVMLITERSFKLTASNVLWGEVTKIQQGPLTSEVTLTLPSGHPVVCVISTESCKTMSFVPGQEAGAFFSPSSVILAAYG